MRISGVFRLALLAAAAVSVLSLPATEANTLAVNSGRNVAAFDASMINAAHETRVLPAAPTEEEEEEVEEAAVTTKPPTKKHKKKKAKATPSSSEESAAEKEAMEEAAIPEPTKKKKKEAKTTTDPTPAPAAEEEETEKTTEKVEETPAPTTSTAVKDTKIKGNKNEGVIDGSSEGSAEIDKIDLRNEDGWVSVYDDPPLLVIKASLYAFISYNDTEVCDTFNMTMNAVEQKAEENGRFSYHVVAYINCTKDGEDETQGRFILNFIPEGKRLLLTECGHREEGEIVNWLRIQEEVPECMTPGQRKKFLAQPMKHIHASNGTATDTEATQTDFLSRLEDFDTEEVAVVGTATVALIAVVVVLVVFVMRKRKAQKDLERTIAGAKAEHAVEDDDLQTEAEEKPTKERKGLMDSSKAKSDDPDMEEGSFVNSPAVRV
jgi:Sec-independent protein translocase protein TatA